MKVTILGTGNMGKGLAKQLAKAGHQITVTARDLDKARALAQAIPNVTAAAAGEALGASDVVVVATAYADAVPALKSLGDLTGKVVIDITNPLTADYMGLTVGHTTSAAEEIAKAVPGAQVVKAFNTVFAQILAEGPQLHSKRVPVYYATDSEAAGKTVHALIDSTGFSPVNAGPLKNARYLEPLAGLNIYFGYGAGHGTSIAPSWIGIA
ncbi:NADPH-dependent F420 reductase [Noviherbaspirillum denitrificans]|uniref:NADPH-dependent F420 reductase n=1 Tax=Noviherbaspirillum denitrificans TaxID=1968433 RepID=A0A254TIN9_9BURK|nr:NADPH-dependent F420 reductase [Noviherbaspirillum denitrificans]OWW22499.1 NADPH-dependent F420 reductase [Noviherbaspirillum denitrificans]